MTAGMRKGPDWHRNDLPEPVATTGQEKVSLKRAHSYGEGNAPQPQPTGRDARMRQLLVFTDPDESKMLEAKCLPVFHSP